jgi:tRNA (guanine10-N2)-dimethyltransferase
MTDNLNAKSSLFLFELSGEHPTLPSAEALACVEAECPDHSSLGEGSGYRIFRFGRDHAQQIANRVALTHRFGRFLGACDLPDLERFLNGLELPEGSISIRAKRF